MDDQRHRTTNEKSLTLSISAVIKSFGLIPESERYVRYIDWDVTPDK